MSTDNAILRQIVFALTGTFEGASTNTLLQRILTAFSSGVFQFRQQAKPTTRPNGSALVSGDRWFSTDDRLWFFWDGTYWMTETLFRATNGSTNVGLLPANTDGFDFWVERFEVGGQTGATNTGVAFARFTLERRNDSADTPMSILETGALGANARFYLFETLTSHIDSSAVGLTSFRSLFTSVGGGSTPTGVSQGFRYRLIKP